MVDWNARLTELEAATNNNRKREDKTKTKSSEQKSSISSTGLGDIIEGVRNT